MFRPVKDNISLIKLPQQQLSWCHENLLIKLLYFKYCTTIFQSAINRQTTFTKSVGYKWFYFLKDCLFFSEYNLTDINYLVVQFVAETPEPPWYHMISCIASPESPAAHTGHCGWSSPVSKWGVHVCLVKRPLQFKKHVAVIVTVFFLQTKIIQVYS